MSIAKVIEVISEGDSVDAAIKSAVQEASKTIENIKQVNVKNIEAVVDHKKNKVAVTKFRVNCKISFIIEH
jgi:dodecin